MRHTITAADRHRLEVARAEPTGTPKGGVIVLHAIYGLTNHIRGVCETWAANGYVGIAPALFDRVGKGLVHPHTREGGDAGRKCYEALTGAMILADIAACRDALRESGPVIVSGFCSGGSWAWITSDRLDGIAAQVNFYGSHVPRHLDLKPRCPTIMHYGDADHVVPVADIERIKAANQSVEMHLYPGAGHAFFNPEQDHYDGPAAALALERSLGFLERVLSK